MKKGVTIILVAVLMLFFLAKPINDPSFRQNAINSTILSKPSVPNLYKNLYFGDLHIHSSLSSDAFVLGVRASPNDAYRYAKGEVIKHANGSDIALSRPLDFAAVTDHAEYLGMMRKKPAATPLADKSFMDATKDKNKLSITRSFLSSVMYIANHGFRPPELDETAASDAWQQIIDSANQHYLPHQFTTFIGFEWSSQPSGANLHRNVIFKNHWVPEQPYSALNSQDPQDLWRFLLKFEQEHPQGRALAIPHNANLSRGRMYDYVTFQGEKLTAKYAQRRNYFEPLSEILQIKGASETNPVLSMNDEFANYGNYQKSMDKTGSIGRSEGSYAREALTRGLSLWQQQGFNPYEFGFIGSSDGHNSSSPIEENKYHGKLPMMDGTAGLRTNKVLLLPSGINRAIDWESGGLVAVWAQQNTRTGIFSALKNKETYATSGTRIRVRMYGGWEIDSNLFRHVNPEKALYGISVAMGSRMLPHASLSKTTSNIVVPNIVIWASKDPDGANLDRIQIVKGWIDKNGQLQEHVFNVMASDQRVIDQQTNQVERLRNTVNLADASFDKSIGSAQLQVIWKDPQFDAELPCYYYGRVLEIETPRWSTYDAVALGIKAAEPSTIQERAITSAIWYVPKRS